MKKNFKVIIFLLLAFIALYFSRINYGDHGLNKSISACVIAQMKKNNNISREDAQSFCKKEIDKKLKK